MIFEISEILYIQNPELDDVTFDINLYSLSEAHLLIISSCWHKYIRHPAAHNSQLINQITQIFCIIQFSSINCRVRVHTYAKIIFYYQILPSINNSNCILRIVRSCALQTMHKIYVFRSVCWIHFQRYSAFLKNHFLNYWWRIPLLLFA